MFGYCAVFVMIQCLAVLSSPVLFWHRALVCHVLLSSSSQCFSVPFPHLSFSRLSPPVPDPLVSLSVYVVFLLPQVSVSYSCVSHVGMFWFWFLEFFIWFVLLLQLCFLSIVTRQYLIRHFCHSGSLHQNKTKAACRVLCRESRAAPAVQGRSSLIDQPASDYDLLSTLPLRAALNISVTFATLL